MMASKKAHTVTFPLKASGAIDGRDVLKSLRSYLGDQDIKAIQITRYDCVITLQNDAAKVDTCLKGVTVNNRHLAVRDEDNEVTNITIKDLPVEVSDEFVSGHLVKYGKLGQQSLNRSTYKGTNIETGSRTARLLNVEGIIPNEAIWGRYTVRLYCDNKKSACIYCESVEHLHYHCSERRKKAEKLCHICKSNQHIMRDCPMKQAPKDTSEIKIHPFRGENDVLSNLYRLKDPLIYNGKQHYSVEHGYKSAKCKYYGREDLLQSIDNTERPTTMMYMVNDELKQTILDAENLDNWRDNEVAVMRKMLKAKYDVCPEFRIELMRTKDSILVEATSHMKWASGLPGITPTLYTDPKNWPGENMMGKLLMELRASMNDESNPQLTTPVAPVADVVMEQEVEAKIPEPSPEPAQPINHSNTTDESHQQSPVVNLNEVAATAEAEDNTNSHDKSTSDNGASSVKTPPEHSNTTIPNNDTTNPEDLDATGEAKKSIILLIGDSLVVGAAHDNITIMAESGAQLADTERLLHASIKQTQSMHVESIVLALGTNDISKFNSSRTSANVAKALVTSSESYPDAMIHLSSIIPRKGVTKEINQANTKAADVNRYMRDSAGLYKNVKFINNAEVFDGRKVVLKNMYQAHDNKGIHLTTYGKGKLLDNIAESVNRSTNNEQDGKKRLRDAFATPPSAERKSKVADTRTTPETQTE